MYHENLFTDCHGLGASTKQVAVKNFLMSLKVDTVLVQEMKIEMFQKHSYKSNFSL